MSLNTNARKSLRAARFMRRQSTTPGTDVRATLSRISRMSRMSRYSHHSYNKPDEYRIRKSLADYVREELDQQGRALFHQRVVIVGKNPFAAVVAKATATASVTIKKKAPKVAAPQSLHTIQTRLSIFSVHSFAGGVKESDDESEEDSSFTEPLPEFLSESSSEMDFKNKLREGLLKIRQLVFKDTFTTDQLNGLCLCMGDYTLLVLEGADDLVGEFCTELGKVSTEFWTINRVLQVEDRIKDMYFNTLQFRYCSAININEKFPTATPNDEYLMEQHHRTLVDKTRTVCEIISEEIHMQRDSTVTGSTKFRQLNADHFNKMLPEVQRLDLVLASTRFYRNVEAYASIYWLINTERDDDDDTWPVEFQYTPLNVFMRTPYDVNLTFPDYEHGGNTEAAVEDVSSSEPH